VRRSITVLLLALMAVTAVEIFARNPLGPGGRVWLDAHNCYPERGQWLNRLDRALGAGVPTAIEQDLVWTVDTTTGDGRSVVAHGLPLTGAEPTLEQHFFRHIAPRLERALTDGRRDTWPVLVLHLDFKTNEPAHHDAIWELLGRYERWLTTATRVADDAQPSALVPGPLLVLTENGVGQASRFHDQVPIGTRLRIFGTVPAPEILPDGTPDERAAAAVSVSAETLIPSRATSYRRWTNFPWAVDPVLHPQRPRSRTRRRMDRWLQLRRLDRGTRAMAGQHPRRRRLHRDRSVRRAGFPAQVANVSGAGRASQALPACA
jgi:hypothetical protein